MGSVKRVAIAVLLVVLLCVAACGNDEPEPALAVPSWAKVAPEQLAEAKIRSNFVGPPDSDLLVSEHKFIRWKTIVGDRRFRQVYTASALALSPNGKWLASGGDFGDIKIWESRGGREAHTLRGHRDVVRALAYTPDGELLVSGSRDGTLQLWLAASGQLKQTFRAEVGHLRCLAVSPDGSWVVSGGTAGVLEISDLATGATRRTLQRTRRRWPHSSEVVGVAVGPDSKRIVAGCKDGSLEVWGAATGELLHSLPRQKRAVTCIAMGPAGERIVVGCADGTVHVSDAMTGQSVSVMRGHTAEVLGVLAGPKSKWVASCSRDGTVKLWDTASGRLLRTLSGHRGPVHTLARDALGSWLISGSEDDRLRKWDVATGRESQPSNGLGGMVLGLAVEERGARAIVRMAHGSLAVVDAVSGEPLQALAGRTDRLPFDVIAANWRFTLALKTEEIAALWSHRTGQVVASASNVVASTPNTDPRISALCMSPDGTWFVTALLDGTLRSWVAETGKPIRTFKGGPDWGPLFVAVGPDPTWFVSGHFENMNTRFLGILKIWSTADGTLLRTLRGHHDAVQSVSFGPGGDWIVSGSAGGVLIMWDPMSGKLLRKMFGPVGDVGPIEVSADGNYIFAVGGDRRLRVWEASTGAAVDNIWIDGVAMCMALRGDEILIGCRNGTICTYSWRPKPK